MAKEILDTNSKTYILLFLDIVKRIVSSGGFILGVWSNG